jgi:hypothetical protein
MFWETDRFPEHLTYFASVFYSQTVSVSDGNPVLLLSHASIRDLKGHRSSACQPEKLMDNGILKDE